MKVYSISRPVFYLIFLLILALPVSRNWRLLTGGEKTTGTVEAYSMFVHETRSGMKVLEYASEIHFMAGDSACTTYGPLNFEYTPGRTIRIRYDPENPGDNCLVTFTGFYLSNYSVLPLVLLILWAAFYLSYNNYQKKRKEGTGELADSPYRPVNRNKELNV